MGSLRNIVSVGPARREREREREFPVSSRRPPASSFQPLRRLPPEVTSGSREGRPARRRQRHLWDPRGARRSARPTMIYINFWPALGTSCAAVEVGREICQPPVWREKMSPISVLLGRPIVRLEPLATSPSRRPLRSGSGRLAAAIFSLSLACVTGAGDSSGDTNGPSNYLSIDRPASSQRELRAAEDDN